MPLAHERNNIFKYKQHKSMIQKKPEKCNYKISTCSTGRQLTAAPQAVLKQTTSRKRIKGFRKNSKHEATRIRPYFERSWCASFLMCVVVPDARRSWCASSFLMCVVPDVHQKYYIKYMYISCIFDMDGRIHPKGVVQHRRWQACCTKPEGWIFRSHQEHMISIIYFFLHILFHTT